MNLSNGNISTGIHCSVALVFSSERVLNQTVFACERLSRLFKSVLYMWYIKNIYKYIIDQYQLYHHIISNYSIILYKNEDSFSVRTGIPPSTTISFMLWLYTLIWFISFIPSEMSMRTSKRRCGGSENYEEKGSRKRERARELWRRNRTEMNCSFILDTHHL